MEQDNKKKGSKKTYVRIGGVWLHRRAKTGVQFLKIQVIIDNKPVLITAWPNRDKGKGHPDAADFICFVPELMLESPNETDSP